MEAAMVEKDPSASGPLGSSTIMLVTASAPLANFANDNFAKADAKTVADTEQTGRKAAAAAFYLFLSVGITYFNKALLADYAVSQENTLLFLQAILSLAGIELGRRMNWLEVPPFNVKALKAVAPMTLAGLLSAILSLTALRLASVSTFSVAKRLTSAFLILLDWIFFGRLASVAVQTAVLIAVIGSVLVSAGDDDAPVDGNNYHWLAFGLAAGSCFCKAVYLLLVKILNTRRFGTTELMMYSYFTALVACPVFIVLAEENMMEFLRNAPWHKPGFLLSLTIFMLEGPLLQIATFACTTITSALTTSVVSQAKVPISIVVDAVVYRQAMSWSAVHFAGIAFNQIGSVWFAYLELFSHGHGHYLPGRNGVKSGIANVRRLLTELYLAFTTTGTILLVVILILRS